MAELLERGSAQQRLRSALGAAAAGNGRLVVLDAAAGLGKSALLAWAAEEAGARGMPVLRARGSEHERAVPHGVVLQLLEHQIARAAPERRRRLLDGAAELASGLLLRGEVAEPSAPEAVRHGIWWVVQNLAAEAPVALVVDDLHWADPPSLRALRYLAARLGDAPVALLAATRPAAPDDAVALRDDPFADRIAVEPLSRDAVAVLVAEAAPAAPPALADACARSTGGNPFVLREVLAHLPPGARDVTVAPGTVARLVLDDVRRADGADAATALAHAVAVLDEDAELRHAAALAGLSPEAADAAADALVGVGVLVAGAPLRFIHPLARKAVEQAMPPAARARAHLTAARRLHDEGARAARVAAHLLHAPRDGDPWVVERLREAAEAALAQGAPDAAVAALERALEEPPPPPLRVELLRALGRARTAAGSPEAPAALREALATDPPPALRAALLEDLGDACFSVGRAAEAAEAYDQALTVAADEDDRRRLVARYATAAMLESELAPAAARRVEEVLARPAAEDGPVERTLCATLAIARAYALAPVEEVRSAARRALADGRFIDDGIGDGAVFSAALGGAIWADDLDTALGEATRGLEQARAGGALSAFATVSNSRAAAHLRAGAVDEALADAQQAIDASRHGWEALLPVVIAQAVTAHLERCELEDAEALLRNADRERLHGSLMLAYLRHADGEVATAAGDHAAARAAFADVGRIFAPVSPNPAILGWRSGGALAALALGEDEAAGRLAAEEVELARAFGAARALGVALRTLGIVRRDAKLLQEAITVLEGSPARLELARALVDLGALLRRSGARARAREPLARGREIAHRCGARALERRARDEQRAAGLRPRSAALGGVDALSPSEQRVAKLAAGGLTNRAIAQQLFVTPKAVEWHLSNTYRKLGIRSRRDLAGALSAGR